MGCYINSKHDVKEEQEQGLKEAYLSCPGVGECGPHKLHDEVTKGIKAADEKLNILITPPESMVPIAPPNGKMLKTKGQKLKSNAAHLIASMEELLLLTLHEPEGLPE